VDGSLSDAARGLLGSARALIEELHEEGVEHFEALPPQSFAPAPAAPSPASRTEAPARPMTAARSVAGQPSPAETNAADPAATEPDARPFGDSPTLEEVRAILGDCTRCGLCKGRTNLVFGDGHPNADLMFVGEGPGQNEDEQGLPFVGRAGELLTQMIEKGLGIPRSDVYICNIVKCRPPRNRTPLPDEVATCRPFLYGQIDAIKPKVIVALGKPATSLLLGRDVSITRVRGTWFEYRGIPLMPTLHPAYVLRQYTPEVRRQVWEDLKAALARSAG
jgi:DNA polymerase